MCGSDYISFKLDEKGKFGIRGIDSFYAVESQENENVAQCSGLLKAFKWVST